MLAARRSWLSITPEPERELPAAVAVLIAGHGVGVDAVGRERLRLETVVLRRGLRGWITYLRSVIGLLELRTGATDPEVVRARRRARAVLVNHHNLLLGLPGAGASLTVHDRARLAELADPEEDRP
jgi:hypothetical protein